MPDWLPLVLAAAVQVLAVGYWGGRLCGRLGLLIDRLDRIESRVDHLFATHPLGRI